MPSKPINNKNKIGKNKIEIKREKYTTKLWILNLVLRKSERNELPCDLPWFRSH